MLDHNNYALGAKIYFQRENEGTMAASLISPVICTRIEVIFFYFFFSPETGVQQKEGALPLSSS